MESRERRVCAPTVRFATVTADGPRNPLNPAEPAPVADVSFPTWKVAAVTALATVHDHAAVAMRERDWRTLYVRGLDPDKAAKAAARDYDATHPPEWVKGSAAGSSNRCRAG